MSFVYRDNHPAGGWLLAAGCLVLGLAPAVHAAKLPGLPNGARRDLKPAAVEDRLRRDIRYLASDDLEGRGVGTPGIDKAAEYIRDQFRQAGLQSGVPDGSYYQRFEMSAGCALGKVNRLALEPPRPPGSSRPGAAGAPATRLGANFRPLSFGGEGAFRGPLVFAGYGITAREKAGSYDDYAGIDVRGRVVLVLRREPHGPKPNSLFAGSGLTRHAALRAKASNAVRHGAAAVVFVSDSTSAATGDRLLPFDYAGCERPARIPMLQITRGLADTILKDALGQDLATLERKIDSDGRPRSRRLEGWIASGTVSIDHRMVPVQNVIGVLPGQGPHADQTIVVGAHYDHLGHGGMGSLAPGSHAIHHGADDNASGCAAVMELARRLSGHTGPHRRIVFIGFTGEETGLIGSAYYMKHPVFPTDPIVAMINFDMVGRLKNDALTVFGVQTAKTFPELVRRSTAEHGFKLNAHADGFGPSDQSSFYARNIPVLFFFTGNHSDYHRPTDTADKINDAGEARIIVLAAQVIEDLADADAAPVLVKVPPEKHHDVAVTSDMPRLGIIPDYSDDTQGVRIQGVRPGSPAETVGLRSGDTITAFDGAPVQNIYDYTYALQRRKPGDKVRLTILRGARPITLLVVLGQPPGAAGR